MKSIFLEMYKRATILNYNNIVNLLEKNNKAVMLDLGCYDGILTTKLANKLNTKNVYGAEISNEQIKIAKKKGIKVKKFDLNTKFNFPDNFFDVVIANQVIEHLYNSENFLSEIFRVLKPKGYAIISTENASSWINIFASIMGWQIFSLTNISNRILGVGNPIALHRGERVTDKNMNHIRVYNWTGLKELLEIQGFKVKKVKGAGYYPFPAVIGNLDKLHSHFMTFKVQK